MLNSLSFFKQEILLAHTGKAKAVDKRLVIYILTAYFIVKHDSLMHCIWCVIDFLVACYPAETSNTSALFLFPWKLKIISVLFENIMSRVLAELVSDGAWQLFNRSLENCMYKARFLLHGTNLGCAGETQGLNSQHCRIWQ